MSIVLLQGKYCSLRLVRLDDADFILKLRTDEKKSLHLNPTVNDLQKQIDWLTSYKEREAQEIEFYFIIEDSDNKSVGTYRVSDITSTTAIPGSWVIIDGVDDYKAIYESVLLMYDFLFNKKMINELVFDVRKTNKKVKRFHEMYGSELINENDIDLFYVFKKEKFKQMQSMFKKFMG